VLCGAGEQLVRQRFLLRSRAEFEELTGQPAPAGKQYFQHTSLADIIGAYPFRSGLSGAPPGSPATHHAALPSPPLPPPPSSAAAPRCRCSGLPCRLRAAEARRQAADEAQTHPSPLSLAFPPFRWSADVEISRERLLRECFTDFLLGVLRCSAASRSQLLLCLFPL
jgi:hypothetical protein